MKPQNAVIPSVILCALIMAIPSVAAQTAYPTKPIRLIVPYAPGGKSDMIGRLVGKALEEGMGQPVVVDNRSGAGGNLGTDLVAKAQPDGYTMLVGAPGPISINVSLFKKLPYHPLKDLAPVTLVVSTANVLVVDPGLRIKSVKELIQHAKKSPNKLNYGSGGLGSAGHLATELLALMGGIKMNHIPYKGAIPALLDVIAGRTSLIITNMPAAWPHVRSGRLTALAVTTAKRSSAAPELPTIAEAALPGYESDNWAGILAPAGTPKFIVERVRNEIVRGFNRPEVKKLMDADGAEVVGSTPEAFRKLIEREIISYGKVIRESGASAN